MKKKTSEKPRPEKCACGKLPVLVSVRGGKMYTCPDPVKCSGNLRTMWHRHEILAIEEWNGLVAGFAAGKRKINRR